MDVKRYQIEFMTPLTVEDTLGWDKQRNVYFNIKFENETAVNRYFFLTAFILYQDCSLQYVFTQLNQKKSNGKKYYRSKLNKIIMLIITADIL